MSTKPWWRRSHQPEGAQRAAADQVIQMVLENPATTAQMASQLRGRHRYEVITQVVQVPFLQTSIVAFGVRDAAGWSVEETTFDESDARCYRVVNAARATWIGFDPTSQFLPGHIALSVGGFTAQGTYTAARATSPLMSNESTTLTAKIPVLLAGEA
ncbi:hypothetical protein [Streptacidiphilus sp. EB129]|uniref:hypothetical protein n=1 Tax=Streptacidiphilus sp. EB129 TaxID=3156262 RepID=UPI003517802B